MNRYSQGAKGEAIKPAQISTSGRSRYRQTAPRAVTPASAPEYTYDRRGRRQAKPPAMADIRGTSGDSYKIDELRLSGAMGDIRGTSGDNYKQDELRYAAIAAGLKPPATDIIIPKKPKRDPATQGQQPGNANAEYLEAISKFSPSTTTTEKLAAENLGLEIHKQKYPTMYAKSQDQTYNPLMQSTFGYQTGEAPDQLRRLGITPDMDPEAKQDLLDDATLFAEPGDPTSEYKGGVLPANQEEADAMNAGYTTKAKEFLKQKVYDTTNKTVQDYAVQTAASQVYQKVPTPEFMPFTEEDIESHGIKMPAPIGPWFGTEQSAFTMPLQQESGSDPDFDALYSDPEALGAFLADTFKSAKP